MIVLYSQGRKVWGQAIMMNDTSEAEACEWKLSFSFLPSHDTDVVVDEMMFWQTFNLPYRDVKSAHWLVGWLAFVIVEFSAGVNRT